MESKTGVYEIINAANGKRYVGSALNMPARWAAHQSSLRFGKHENAILQSAWNKYGAESFTFRPILTCAPTKQMLTFYEQQLLDKVQPEYNICKVANSCLGVRHSPETRARMSAAQKNKTPETLAKMSAAQRGKIFSTETKAKLRAARIKRVFSVATKAKMSQSLLGNTRARGVKRTAEFKAKVSRAHKGREWTASQRANVSAAVAASNARRPLARMMEALL